MPVQIRHALPRPERFHNARSTRTTGQRQGLCRHRFSNSNSGANCMRTAGALPTRTSSPGPGLCAFINSSAAVSPKVSPRRRSSAAHCRTAMRTACARWISSFPVMAKSRAISRWSRWRAEVFTSPAASRRKFSRENFRRDAAGDVNTSARLRQGGFLEAFNAKGSYSETMRKVPVSVVLNERLGLLGCAAIASR